MTSGRKTAGLLVAAILIAAAAPVFALESGGPSFVPGLLAQLSTDGWSTQETEALSAAASQLDWSGTQGGDPQVVALALELAKSQDQSLSATEEAQLGLQLAQSAVQMSAVGLDTHSEAAAALAAVRGVLAAIQAWRAGGSQGDLGELIRESVARAVRGQIQNNAGGQSAGRGQDSSGGAGQGPEGNGPPPWTPVSGGSAPPPGHGK